MIIMSNDYHVKFSKPTFSYIKGKVKTI